MICSHPWIRGVCASGAVLFAAAVAPRTANAELVLRLDAMDVSTLTLSSDMTTGSVFGFPDAREVGLNFVEGWGQTYGATANPELNPIFAPLRTSTFSPNLHRPTYDPDGLGPGKPSVNFDFISGDAVLGAGQRLVAGLDNLINSDQYTIFFVGQRLDNRFQAAFGQDFYFRPSGWNVGIDGSGDWAALIGGYDTSDAAVALAPPGTSDGPGVNGVIATSAGTLDHEARDDLGNVVVNSQPRTDYGIYSGGDLVLGNRGGWDTANSIPFNGRIGEIAIFNTELSGTERDAVRAYLENKWVGGPAPTAPQLATAEALLEAPPPGGGAQLLRYEFRRDLPADDIQTILIPDLVHSGVTASDINSGGGLLPATPTPGSFASSVVGISANSAYLGAGWSANMAEQSPAIESPYYLGFTIAPEAGMQIDPTELRFAISRGEANLRSAENGVDSFGVWVDDGDGFVKVGGQEGLGPPQDWPNLVTYYFDTVGVDLSSLGPFTDETEIRIYLWHDGPFNMPPEEGDSHNARIDNVRLYGVLEEEGTGGIAGDYNNDSKVDAADYTVWRDNLGGTTLPNDMTPGTVTQDDFSVWKSNFGMMAGRGSLTGASIPEPSAFVLAGLACAALGAWQRRRRSKGV